MMLDGFQELFCKSCFLFNEPTLTRLLNLPRIIPAHFVLFVQHASQTALDKQHRWAWTCWIFILVERPLMISKATLMVLQQRNVGTQFFLVKRNSVLTFVMVALRSGLLRPSARWDTASSTMSGGLKRNDSFTLCFGESSTKIKLSEISQ